MVVKLFLEPHGGTNRNEILERSGYALQVEETAGKFIISY